MTSNEEEYERRCLLCPVCLDVFKEAVILNCGHSFCKACLKKLDELSSSNHIKCPQCKKKTKLGQYRVAGLTPNFALNGIVEALNEESKLEKKKDDLIQYFKEKKLKVEKSLESCYLSTEAMNSHFDKLEREVMEKIMKKSMVLQENKKTLFVNINELRKESVKQMDKWISDRTLLITSTDRVIAELTGNTSKQKDSLKSHHSKCSELNDKLNAAIDDDSASRLKERVMSAQFRVSEEKVLDLGYLDVAPKAGGSNTSSSSMPDIPAVVKHSSLKIVKDVELDLCLLYGMAASSTNAVVVGYGDTKKGSDYISVSGSIKPHLKEAIGHVHGVAFLEDGSPVVAESKEAFRVYNPQGTFPTGGQECKPGKEFLKVCTDKHDKIYAVNSNPEIYIFHNGNQVKVVPTGRLEPRQICVTREGHAMIISTGDTYPSTVTVYDREGQRVKSFTALSKWCIDDAEDDDVEERDVAFLCAAVDSKDRVLVAKVILHSKGFVLARYTLQGGQLVKEMIFKKSFFLPNPINAYECHMVSLTPNLIAFANCNFLYFIELTD